MTAEAKAPRATAPGELPTETTQASRFGKTRTAQSTALLEDYVELIDDLLTMGGEAAQVSLQLPKAISQVFMGLLLMFLLGCDVLVNYRLRWVKKETA